jgi:tetratricopeptide (TPR) repeat protein
MSEEKKYALIIGISNYNDLLSLELCKNDAEELFGVLSKQEYEISENHKLIGQVTSDTMRDTIYDFFDYDYIKPKDTLLFYFSGHGLPDGTGRHYLAPSDIDKNRPGKKGIAFDELEYWIERCKSSRILTILDCCFSGAAGLEGLKDDDTSLAKKAREVLDKQIKESEGRCILASSLAYQQSIIKKDLGHSLFTYYLLEGLKGKEECVDSNGYVTADLLGNYVYNKILEEPKQLQKPIKKSKASGQLRVAYHPRLAKSELERVNTSHPPSPSVSAEYYWKMDEIDEYERKEDYDSAIPCYQEAIAIDPHNYRLHNRMGKAYFMLERYDDSIQAHDRAIRVKPDHPDAYDAKGYVLFKKGDYKQALACYDNALRIKPKSYESLRHKGLALYELKEYEQAVKCYEKALEIRPNQSEISELKNEALLKFEEFDELKKGISLYDSGNYEEAIECFNRSLKINSKNEQTLYFKGLAFSKLSKYNEAIEYCFDEALRINPMFDEVAKAKASAQEMQRQKEISLAVDQGLQYINKNDYQNAIDSFDKAITFDPKNYIPYYYKGDALIKLEQYDEAVKCLDKTLEIKPDYYYAWYKKGEVLNKKGEDISISGQSSSYVELYNLAIECYNKALAINPNKAEFWYRKGSLLENLDKSNGLTIHDEAIECYTKALEIRPDYAEAYYSKGQALNDSEKYEEAIKCFDEALKIKPSYEEAIKVKGVAYEKQKEKEASLIIREALEYISNGDYENANTSFDKAISVNPNYAVAYYYKGDLYFKKREYKQAIDYHDKALKINPDYIDVIKQKGLALFELKEYEQAVTCFDKALHIKSDQSIVEFKEKAIRNLQEIEELKKGISLYDLDKYDEALICFNRSLEANSKNTQTLYYKGRALAHQSQFNEAISCFDEALKINPIYDEALKAKELAIKEQRQKKISLLVEEGLQYSKNNNYLNAIDSFDKAIKLDPKNYIPYYYKGEVLFKRQEYNEAIECYSKALEIKPDYAEAYYIKGLAFSDLGKHKEAISCFDEALKINPIYDEALKAKEATREKQAQKEFSLIINEGLLYLENEDYENANASFDKAIALKPEDDTTYNLKGAIYLKLSDYRRAIEYYDKALKINSENFDVLRDKGIALYKLGDYEAAITFFDSALRLKPNQSTILQYKKESTRSLQEIDGLKDGISHYNSGRHTKALESLNKSLGANSKNAQTWFYKGLVLMSMSEFKDAISCYEESLKINPIYDEALKAKELAIKEQRQKENSLARGRGLEIGSLLSQGSALADSGNFKDALQKFQSAIELDRNNVDAHSKKSSVLIAMGQFKLALEAANIALSIKPNNADALVNKGYVYAATGQYQNAIELFDKATDIDPNNFDAWINKGNCYDRIKRKKEAKDCFNFAKALKK